MAHIDFAQEAGLKDLVSRDDFHGSQLQSFNVAAGEHRPEEKVGEKTESYGSGAGQEIAHTRDHEADDSTWQNVEQKVQVGSEIFDTGLISKDVSHDVSKRNSEGLDDGEGVSEFIGKTPEKVDTATKEVFEEVLNELKETTDVEEGSSETSEGFGVANEIAAVHASVTPLSEIKESPIDRKEKSGDANESHTDEHKSS